MLVHKLKSMLRLFRLRGWSYLGYLLTGYLIPKLVVAAYLSMDERIAIYGIRKRLAFIRGIVVGVFWLLASIVLQAPFQVAAALLALSIGAALIVRLLRRRELAWMLRQVEALTAEGHQRGNLHFTAWNELPINPDIRARIEKERRQGSELVLAQLDRYGRALDRYGALHFLACVSKENFIPKDRFELNVVLEEGKVLVRKHYCDNHSAFAREWFFLALLQDKARVPAVWKACPESNTLYMNLIPGRSVQQLLGDWTKLKDVDACQDPELKGLSGKELQVRLDARARMWISKVLPEDMLCELDKQLDAIHATGVAGLILKPGNVIVSEQDGKAYLVDFHMLSRQHVRSVMFHLLRDRDRIIANRRFGRALMTERKARTQLNKPDEHWYAPIDFGFGLTVGAFWSIGSGMGRWEVFMREGMPDLRGLRILDLGSNNGCMPMMMLRAGARQVVGVELAPQYYQQALLVHRLFEWRDMRRYDFQLRLGNMLDILEGEWGSFDVVTALCTLYYLQEDDMARIVRRAAELAPTVILQANRKAATKSDPDKPRRASVEFLRDLLRNNGFPQVRVYDPPGMTRPLLIAHRG